MTRTKKALINVLFLIITLGVNALGALGLIGGLSQKDISDMYITLITPSPSTFSIWSLIYTLLIILMIVMIVKKDDLYYQNLIDEITGLFRISCLLNIAWIINFSYLMVELSTIFIFGFVIILSILCLRLLKINDGKHFLAPLTFGMYTGWLFIATVVNIAAALVKIKWDGFGIAPEVLASATLIVSIVLVYIVVGSIRNAVFPLPVAWAYFGIYKFLSSPTGFNGEFANLQIVSIVGMILLILIAAIQFYKNNFFIIKES